MSRIIAFFSSSVTILMLLIVNVAHGQIEVQGTIKDDGGEPLAGVNIVVQGKVIGTITNLDGYFKLNVNDVPPISLSVSMIGFATQVIEVPENSLSVELTLKEDITTLGEVVVRSATRVEENIMQSPVSIEKMGILEVRNTASDDYYKAIANMKGVEMTSSSINFQIINARGFGNTGNTRFVQLTDGMDTQAPALNFPIGNLNGPSVIDVESVELIPGAASALYGPNAFNGILMVTSKSPFEYQGLSAFTKVGVNHVGSDPALGEPDSPQPLYEAAIRYAKAFNNKFAFKVNFAYSRAEDWYGTNYSDKNSALQGNLGVNPAFNGVNMYGDDGGINLGLLRSVPTIRQTVIDGIAAASGFPSTTIAPYVDALPAVNVNRTGYREHFIVDYGAENIKGNVGLNYRINDDLEISYFGNYGAGTSVYTGAQRYSLANFDIQQHKLQLKSNRFQISGYTTIENSGESYIADFTGFGINNAYIDNLTWFGTYAGTIVSQYLFNVLAQNGTADYDAAIVNGLNSSPSAMTNIHRLARQGADGVAGSSRYQPGTPDFINAADSINSGIIPNGAKFNDNTRFYHFEGQYDFQEEIQAFDLLAGAHWRQFDLQSNGTIFPDAGGGIQINEYGAFLQLTDRYLEDKLKFVLSFRYDKNENFDGLVSPRIATVYTAGGNHNFRASFQTGFRNPSTQGQYIDLDVVTARLLGGLREFHDQYQVSDFTYTILSVEAFTESVISGNTDASLLVPYVGWEPVKPERISVYEVGYKGLIDERVMLDISYYSNTYNDFITQIRVRQAQDSNGDPIDPAADPTGAALFGLLAGSATNTFQIYTNNRETVKSQGATVGLDYSIGRGYQAGFTYAWNTLDESSLPAGFFNDYNTPEHVINLRFGNRKVTDNLGFNIAYRYQTAFDWQSSFVSPPGGEVPAYGTLDAQVSYKLGSLKSILKLGGSNVLNERYFSAYGSPTIGAIYYLSISFDELMN